MASKLTFTEVTEDIEYSVTSNGEQVYKILRDPDYWIAYDMLGNKVSHPDQYRHDLFERLEMIHRSK